MPNHGYCKNCWWHKDGICYMQCVKTNDYSYCPDYVNRNRFNKEWTIDGLLKEWKEKNRIMEEWKIGEIRQVNGEWCQCVEGTSCRVCAYHNEDYDLCDTESQECLSNKRSDGKDVIFKKLEKVGEPYEFDGHLFQSYRTFEVPIFTENYATVREYGNNSKISIEIKRTKEDMGENKLNLKPFDIQKAREGKPVCTRDGRRARIICFDLKNDEYPIVAAVEENNVEVVHHYDTKGWNCYKRSGIDLMMLPEKKEGWVNVDKRSNGDVIISKPYPTRDEAIHNSTELTIDTVNIEWEE